MSGIFIDIDAWIIAVILGLLMCGGWRLGGWRDRRSGKQAEQKRESDNATGQLAGASVALLGLLLAFTFSLSLERHEQRRLMVVEHANTIGDFATCASLLKEPVRSQLRQVLHKYVEHVLSIRAPRITEAQVQKGLAMNEQMHNEMQLLVKEAVDDGTPIAVSLVNTLNDLTSSHDARLAAIRNRLPSSIVVLLCLSAIVAMVQIGLQNGKLDERELITGLGFVVLVCLCVWVTLDLNQPQGDMVTISQEPMQRLLLSLSQ